LATNLENVEALRERHRERVKTEGLAQEDIIKAFPANTANGFPEMEFFAQLSFGLDREFLGHYSRVLFYQVVCDLADKLLGCV
jgi:hypothetical protein